MIDAANDLAYALGRTRPVVPIPQGTLPTVHLACPVELPGAIMGIGRVPVRKAIQAGARTVDALLEIYAVREDSTTRAGGFAIRGGWPERDGANPKQRTSAERWLRSCSSCSIDHDRRGPERSPTRLSVGRLRDRPGRRGRHTVHPVSTVPATAESFRVEVARVLGPGARDR